MDDQLLDRQEAAALLRVPPKTLANWAYAGRGPEYFRVGRRTVYRESEIVAWLEEQRVTLGAAATDEA
ncbi:MAG: helix-turn-helix domain-containing protein [Actinomycetota bacterium]